MLRILLLLSLVAGTAEAQCLTAKTGAGCSSARVIVRPPTTPPDLGPPPVEIGELLERGAYNIVMNARYYGLPPARDGWVYFRVEDDVFRVDYNTMRVLERATAEAGANWPP